MSTYPRGHALEWQNRAACREADPRMFTDSGPGRVPVAALRICRGCGVRVACLTWALAQPSGLDYGVLGGTSEGSRRRIRNGTSTRAAAMARGDAMSDMRTPDEQVLEEEPWLFEEPA